MTQRTQKLSRIREDKSQRIIATCKLTPDQSARFPDRWESLLQPCLKAQMLGGQAETISRLGGS